MPVYFCCDPRRRAALRAQAECGKTDLIGIDFLEVVDQGAPPCERQRLLQIHFINPQSARLEKLQPEHIRISGGERIRDVRAIDVRYADSVLEVRVNTPGDFSPYVLSLVDAQGKTPEWMDPQLSAVEFSFKVECPTDLDCRAALICPPEPAEAPEIDYLAKDYASFRQLMLDRLSVLMPQWRERNPADLGIALVELLAYVGDRLSYQQDAVAAEAYLGTARRRESVRRHARLLDYFMHDGRNARTWVQVRLKRGATGEVTLPKGTPLLTATEAGAGRIEPDSSTRTPYRDALRSDPVVFETMEAVTLHPGYERLTFYTWGERACCLPAGATRATLLGALDKLTPGTVLIFVEQVGPRTGHEQDADPQHRHPVRLTEVSFGVDPLYHDGDGEPTPVTEIAWAEEDALPFPLCLSAAAETGYVCNVSVALGNIVLADHGRTIEETLRPAVPEADPRLARVTSAADEACDQSRPEPAPPRYRPRLSQGPLTMTAMATWTEWLSPAAGSARSGAVKGQQQRGAFNPKAPAAAAIPEGMGRVLPAISLTDDEGRPWDPQRDLLSSDASALEFALEVAEDGLAALRFGDDEHGMRPAAGTEFQARYRIGNGTQGNIGAGSLVHIVTDQCQVARVDNPLPARGGVDPEAMETVRQQAPSAFRVPQRAVTPADYAEMAQRHRGLQRAVARLRWTGSWHTVFLTADRVGGRPVEAEFEARLRDHLERYRLAGHDLEINGPRFVPLEVELQVCVRPDYYRGDVKAALLEVLSNRTLPDGRRGLFQPDRLTFGQTVYLSPIYAAAQAVPGVRYVEVRTFQRLGQHSRAGLEEGRLEMKPLEIARLDNDPNFSERGVLRLVMEGGR